MKKAADTIESQQVVIKHLEDELRRCTSGNGTYISIESHNREVAKLQADLAEERSRRYQAECNYDHAVADREKLRAQLAESKRRAQDTRNELCQKCGRYHEAHKGACDGCRWRKENLHEI